MDIFQALLVSDSDNSDSESTQCPDSKCTICLGKLCNKSTTEICSHSFCFECLLKWSKIKAECPLCKQPFKTIYFNYNSNGKFDRLNIILPQPDWMVNDTPIMPDLRRSTPEFFEMAEQSFWGEIQFPREYFRKLIYIRRYYFTTSRVPESDPIRESSPSYYNANPSQLDRIRPWLIRELQAVGCYHEIRHTTERIISNLCRFHIKSSHFRIFVSEFIPSRVVDHFIHELSSFATSVYDMNGFDESALYSHSPGTILPPIEIDSDIEVIHESYNIPDDAHSTSSTLSQDLFISDTNFTSTPTEVILISSDDESQLGSSSTASPSIIYYGSQSNTLRSRNTEEQPSTSRHFRSEVSNSINRRFPSNETRRRNRKRRACSTVTNIRSDNESDDDNLTSKSIKKRRHKSKKYENHRKSDLRFVISRTKPSEVLKMNPVHMFHKRNLSKNKKSYRKAVRRRSIEDDSTSNDKSLRSLVVVPESSRIPIINKQEENAK